jgi:hypothetical protein
VDHKIDVSDGYIEALRLVNERLKLREREVVSAVVKLTHVPFEI